MSVYKDSKTSVLPMLVARLKKAKTRKETKFVYKLLRKYGFKIKEFKTYAAKQMEK